VKNNYRDVRDALNQIVSAKQILRNLKVIRSERFTGELGEWFVGEMYNALPAASTSQKGWDLMLGDRRIQVKTHAKGDGNNARWTELGKYTEEDFDELIIVVFTKEFSLKELYKVPVKDAISHVKGKQRVIGWNDISRFKIKLKNLPKQDLVKLFCAYTG
jgi:hypothetical protein